MNKKFLIIGVIAVALLAVGGGLFFVNSKKTTSQTQVLSEATTQPEEETPILEIFSGNVQIKTTGSDFTKAIDKQKVNVGDVIKTGADGRAQILYPTHSVTRIDFNSRITVEEYTKAPSKTKVKVDDGRIWSRVAKLFGKDDENTTETDTLVASVRGTSYGLGILDDGNNKISVTKSHVYVECKVDASKNTTVDLGNKLTTKCQNKLSEVNLGSDINDEWFKFNNDQDKILDARFGGDSYSDQATPTPTPTHSPTPKPTATLQVQGAATTAPTSSPTPGGTPQPVTINDITVVCGPYSNNLCSSRGATTLKIIGTGYSDGQHPIITATSKNSESNQTYTGSAYSFSGDSSGSSMLVDFSQSLYGTYTIQVQQNGQTPQKDITIGYQE